MAERQVLVLMCIYLCRRDRATIATAAWFAHSLSLLFICLLVGNLEATTKSGFTTKDRHTGKWRRIVFFLNSLFWQTLIAINNLSCMFTPSAIVSETPPIFLLLPLFFFGQQGSNLIRSFGFCSSFFMLSCCLL